MKKITAILVTSAILITAAIFPISAAIKYTGVQLDEVPQIYQLPELPWGCEATALTALSNYYGYKFTKQNIWDNTPTHPMEIVGNRVYAEHPDVSMTITSKGVGFGIYAPLAEKILNEMIKTAGGNHKAVNLSGCTEDELFTNLPKVVWATGKMGPTEYGKSKWYLKVDGVYTDELFNWRGNEHAMVLLSATDKTVRVMDPISGTVDYARDAFLREWNNQGKQVIAFEKVFYCNVYLNGYKVNYGGIAPVQIGEKIYIPAKPVFKLLGLKYYHEAERHEAMIFRGDQLMLKIDAESSKVQFLEDVTETEFPVAKQIDGTLMIDLEYLVSIQSELWCEIKFKTP